MLGHLEIYDTCSKGASDLRALVVFENNTRLSGLRWLRTGFRHCFVALQRDEVWVVCNPFSHYTDLDVVIGWTGARLGAWYRQHGFLVVETVARVPAERCAPIRPFTCVEVVKRVLGVRAPWVLTPWQLYRHLTRPNDRSSA